MISFKIDGHTFELPFNEEDVSAVDCYVNNETVEGEEPDEVFVVQEGAPLDLPRPGEINSETVGVVVYLVDGQVIEHRGPADSLASIEDALKRHGGTSPN